MIYSHNPQIDLKCVRDPVVIPRAQALVPEELPSFVKYGGDEPKGLSVSNTSARMPCDFLLMFNNVLWHGDRFVGT